MFQRVNKHLRFSESIHRTYIYKSIQLRVKESFSAKKKGLSGRGRRFDFVLRNPNVVMRDIWRVGIPDSSSIMGEKQNSKNKKKTVWHFLFQKVLSYRT